MPRKVGWSALGKCHTMAGDQVYALTQVIGQPVIAGGLQ